MKKVEREKNWRMAQRLERDRRLARLAEAKVAAGMAEDVKRPFRLEWVRRLNEGFEMLGLAE